MNAEQKYTEQLRALGVWDEAFASEVHTLCMMERELRRIQKAWKATAETNQAPSSLSPLYDQIGKLRRDILAQRDALGLTPRAMLRLKRGQLGEDAQTIGTMEQTIRALIDKCEAYE